MYRLSRSSKELLVKVKIVDNKTQDKTTMTELRGCTPNRMTAEPKNGLSGPVLDLFGRLILDVITLDI